MIAEAPMAKSFFCLLTFLLCFTASPSLKAQLNFEQIYPASVQRLQSSYPFQGDRHGDFEGDHAAVLTDGSAWKVHPDSRKEFERWRADEKVIIKARTSWYLVKREHKFLLYNCERKKSAKVMLVQHKQEPINLTIISTHSYPKSHRLIPQIHTIWQRDADGHSKPAQIYTYELAPCNFRKVLHLSDGSVWVIKEKFSQFNEGAEVYIGAQGKPNVHYDFVIISGDEREADWTYARPSY